MVSEREVLEVFRLGELAVDAEVVRVTADWLSGVWLSHSRFVDTRDLLARSNTIQTSAVTLNQLARAHDRLGDRVEALAFFNEALPIRRVVGDRAGEAATLSNIGSVHDSLGDRVQALAFYHQALPIQRVVGDRAGEAVTRYNIAMVHRADGRLDDAITELELTVELDRQTQHPDLESDTATLTELREQRQQNGRSQ